MRLTNISLIDQLRITEAEISDRMNLLEFTFADKGLLRACSHFMEEELSNIVSDFYDVQTKNDDITLLIGDSGTLENLKNAQINYISSLFSGHYGLNYVNNRLRIGIIHKRIGVEPKLYLSAIKLLENIICKALEKNISDASVLSSTKKALEKLIYFDITLVFDTYIRSMVSEIESSKSKVEEYSHDLERKIAERTKQLDELSQRDPLTNLYNRRSFEEQLHQELARGKRTGSSLSLVYFDVDKFKLINDKKGHSAGDQVLISIADTLLAKCRELDSPCRLGGDEFCIILPNCDQEYAEAFCHRIINELKKTKLLYSLSIGIVQSDPDHQIPAESLVAQADKLMYQSKKKEGFHISK